MPGKPKRKRRRFSEEFKRDAVNLVVKQGYSFKAAADAVGVADRSLREWHEKLAPEPEPCGDDASVKEMQEEIKRLRKQLQLPILTCSIPWHLSRAYLGIRNHSLSLPEFERHLARTVVHRRFRGGIEPCVHRFFR